MVARAAKCAEAPGVTDVIHGGGAAHEVWRRESLDSAATGRLAREASLVAARVGTPRAGLP